MTGEPMVINGKREECGGSEDLYYRLNVFAIRTPALRERLEDIPILTHHFALRYAQPAGRLVRGVSPEVLDVFQKYSWPETFANSRMSCSGRS
jgi:DNA-binding NtrC family response regulator